MGKKYDSISAEHKTFIQAQKLFFVATAAAAGQVNVSPKGSDCLRVLDDNRVIWLNLTGSGNETMAHIRRIPRMTLMFCAFEGEPKILRLYGKARLVMPDDADWADLYANFEPRVGARQIYDVTVDLAQTSCGFGIPYFDYAGDRDTLRQWENKKGESGIREYWALRNARSLDGEDTGINDHLETKTPD